jgi:IS30 family transposase
MSYAHLSATEREVIAFRRIAGDSLNQIARLLGRSHSTISRELRRNSTSTLYAPQAADKQARERRHKARHAKRRNDAPLVAQVLEWLRQEWTPEIIVAKLRMLFPRDCRMRVSVETIYQWVYANASAGGDWYRYLWRPRKQRRKQRNGLKKILIPNRTGIEERPSGANNRSRYGHWEGDTVEGRKGSGGLATHVDRKSRYLLGQLLSDKRATSFSGATCASFSWIPKSLRRSCTYDNGTENADHQCITVKTGMDIYFADPYSPWQRGTNEQTNGLIRRYFPKGTDFSKVTQEEVDAVVMKINKRPRKCLGYRSPYDVFAEALRCALAN